MESNNQPEPVLGIDLGTTESAVSVWNYNQDRVDSIENFEGYAVNKNCTSSYFALKPIAGKEPQPSVGKPAKDYALRIPEAVAFCAKRLIGKKFSDPEVQEDIKKFPFKVVSGDDDSPLIELWPEGPGKGKPQTLTPAAVGGQILSNLKNDAESFLGKKISKAVITVPAYFTQAQIQETNEAAKVAGLECLKYLKEPTAAAISVAHGKKYENDQTIMVFDLGGGTFDVSIVRVTIDKGFAKKYEVKGFAGNNHLGGEDFDSAFTDFVLQRWQESANINHDEFENWKNTNKNARRTLHRLRLEVRKAKETLSFADHTQVCLPGAYIGESIEVPEISKAEFEQTCMGKFDMLRPCIEEAMSAANVTKHQIDTVAMIGGSSKIPYVQNLLRGYVGTEKVNVANDANLAVTMGAAIQAKLLSDESVEIFDLTPVDIGVRTSSSTNMSVVVPRNTQYPTSFAKKYEKTFLNQAGMTDCLFEFYQGEVKAIQACHKLGEVNFELKQQKKPAHTVEMVVQINIDKKGVVFVTIREVIQGGGMNQTTRRFENSAIDSEEAQKAAENARVFSARLIVNNQIQLIRAEILKCEREAKQQTKDATKKTEIGNKVKAALKEFDAVFEDLEAAKAIHQKLTEELATLMA